MNRLEPIIAATREEVERRRARTPVAELAPAEGTPRDFVGALARPGLSLIAEHKRRSPSAGPIREDLSLAEVVGAYERAGAAALSVLTNEPSFGGSLEDLRQARAACGLPILRKDFVVDPYQVYESRAAGADALLLIVAALSPGLLHDLHELAGEVGLATLVEVHDAAELETALALEPAVIGINNRDLRTLVVDTSRTFELLPRVPEGTVVVAESGFRNRDELASLARAGVHAVLVGEALMRSADVESACRELIRGL